MKKPCNSLAGARVHIGGVGRIGTSIALALHAAGVGEISCNDPQNFEEEQLGVCVYSRRSDIGRPKVRVLERFLDGRPTLTFTGIVAGNQSPKVRPYLEKADVIVSCANNLGARLYLERQAIQLNKPCVQACAYDARAAIGGVVTAWTPKGNCSCFGCLFPNPKQKVTRGEILLPAVTATIGALAANLITDILAPGVDIPGKHNIFLLDLRDYKLESFATRPRPRCGICGRR